MEVTVDDEIELFDQLLTVAALATSMGFRCGSSAAQRWRVRGTSRIADVWIPSIPSLALLKLKAVQDELERVGVERDGARLEFERGRLQRHGDDLLTLLRWSEERGEFVEVTRRVRADAEVGAVALEAERRLAEIRTQLVHGYRELRDGVRRLARSADSQPS